jgi:predicted ATPase
LPLGSDAEILFTDRAWIADPEFAADPATVAEICARLDGLPLAIELGAARIPALGVGGVLAGLDDSLRLLAGGRGTDERHHSLRAVIGWSYDLLDNEERSFFRHLAVFDGTFALNAAVAVTSVGARPKVADLLGRLVDKNLVVHQRGTPGGWRLLDTMRAFATDRLRADGEEARARERRRAWFAAHATNLGQRIGGQWRDESDAVARDLRAWHPAATSNHRPAPTPATSASHPEPSPDTPTSAPCHQVQMRRRTGPVLEQQLDRKQPTRAPNDHSGAARTATSMTRVDI